MKKTQNRIFKIVEQVLVSRGKRASLPALGFVILSGFLKRISMTLLPRRQFALSCKTLLFELVATIFGLVVMMMFAQTQFIILCHRKQ